MPAKRGADYLASLRDGRALYARGERVADVTAHPQFKRTAESLAGLFDLQHAPDTADQLTYPSPLTGERVPMGYLIPTSRANLVRRRVANRIVAEWSYGTSRERPTWCPRWSRSGPCIAMSLPAR